MQPVDYLMESDEETHRLDLKTDIGIVKKQALWAGIKPGMRMADLGFGSGKTTHALNTLVQPGGHVVGADIASDRVQFATANYAHPAIEYHCRDICEPLEDLGSFDFIWIRFVLEYHRSESFDMVKNITRILKPGGILCLIDLDYNCLSHYGLPPRLEKALFAIMSILEKDFGFDPYVGRKLYAYLFDLGFGEIDLDLSPHHLIYGELKEVDAFNWTKKIEVAAKKSGYGFDEYKDGFDEFYEEFKSAFSDPRRFTYTPVISCRGVKPAI